MNSLNFIPALTENNFTEAISKEINPVVVIFKTDWYGITYIMAPILEEIARNFAGKVSFFTFNYDENSTITKQYEIQNMITFLFFIDGKAVDQVVGPVSAKTLRTCIEKVFFKNIMDKEES